MPSRSLFCFLALIATVSTVLAQTPAAPAPMATPAAPPPYAAVLGPSPTTLTGLLAVHKKGEQVFFELQGGDYSSEYLVLMALCRGIGQGQLLGGMTLGFGDDWVWQFRKLDDKVHIVRKNVRFKATPGSPESTAMKFAYTDSVLFSLPIIAKGPKGGDLIDLTPVFMSDLPQLGQMLPGFGFSPQKSTWADVKDFEKNLELEVAATYASGGTAEIETVPDSRGVTINIRYSVSKIPQTEYQPRLADDRVGYFLTVVKDISSKSEKDQFVRYINRWDLQKADPSAAISPPKPLNRARTPRSCSGIEKTVPYQISPAQFARHSSNGTRPTRRPASSTRSKFASSPTNADWDPEDVTLQHVPLDHRRGRLRHGPLPRESLHRPNSRCRHHLRCRLPPILEGRV